MADNDNKITRLGDEPSEPPSDAADDREGAPEGPIEGVISNLFDVETPEERRGLRRGIYLLPNLITTGALFSGFYAIIAALAGSLEGAAIAIIIAGFLDVLDGRIARLTNTQSEFGVQYDSLSDLVAFGVAPAVLMFSWVLGDLDKLGWTIAFLYMACTALRLARFNTAPDNKVFTGLASPAAAGILATSVWVWVDNFEASAGIEMAIPMAVVTVLLALLMVSGVRYYSPKQVNLKGQVPFFYIVAVILLFALVFTYPPGILLGIGIGYAISGPIWSLLRRRRKIPATGEKSL
ncbi:MAG: CDP-diacylglycerol--serine O-phosphatidyltransferase [Gammaproteobacteria bacterium]|nr:CDP-diacylglycerol--serine O-phosphatidyltransferase [Gammaproteobacteria bacterium]